MIKKYDLFFTTFQSVPGSKKARHGAEQKFVLFRVTFLGRHPLSSVKEIYHSGSTFFDPVYHRGLNLTQTIKRHTCFKNRRHTQHPRPKGTHTLSHITPHIQTKKRKQKTIFLFKNSSTCVHINSATIKSLKVISRSQLHFHDNII